ncbi:MAG TPA: bifunctional DNA-formamidopyrimidine glycosylase/DNA-(apurinic or apyrimidinic site) lyase [Bryobacteraceae bacterium]|jgi:formamidopyrimidine-DNA glycosylase|nr:bifunctional DNA-formamidopyrimidine glycosylase/DNA-(apurinic or apyrimidinic site) lyase [Bryobacteraceae bacterium]
MPELPEVETVVRSVAAHLAGRRIVSTTFTSRFVTPGNRAKLTQRLAGRRIESVTRRGKFILIALDQGTLTVHLGMTGKLLLEGEAGEHTHGVFHLDDGMLLYHDPRQFGRIEWSPGPPPRVARLGPEPLEIGFEEFRARLKRKTRMKALLLNQTFLAGLGNIYADESLFAAGIHPLAVANRLSTARAKKLYEAIRGILSHAIKLGGSSISDYVNGRGERGWFQMEHRVYGREGEPCANCGRPIRKILVAQRGTHYCPHCQKK